jgi:hypothetical protein
VSDGLPRPSQVLALTAFLIVGLAAVALLFIGLAIVWSQP